MQKELTNHTSLLGQAEIIQAIKRNDDLVLKHLYQKNYPKVEQYILKNQGTSPQAKDIFQEAFLAMWKNVKLGKFLPKGESALDGYLYTIARNKWTDFLRSSRFKKTVSVDKDIDLERQQADAGEEEENPHMKNTLTAYARLGEDCRSLLNRFYFEKKSLKDISDELGIGAASVRNKKYRCMQKLRELAHQESKDYA